jgi:hypothetical protein
MKLASGACSVELQITRYEFPERRASGDDYDWDANWLTVHGYVRVREHKWSFEDPCMTTREAAELGRWLRGVGNGNIHPDGLSGSGSLWFTEPNITFGLRSRSARSATVMVSLGAESRPPSSTGQLRDEVEQGIELEMALEDVIDAAEDWDRGLVAFTER